MFVDGCDEFDGNAAATLLGASGCDPATITGVEAWGAGDVVGNPRMLVAWAQLVERDRAPANRLELYQRLTQLAASESNKVVASIVQRRRDSVAVVALARRAAALSTLGRRSTLVVDDAADGIDRINIAALHSAVDDPVSTAAWLSSSPLLVPSGDGWLFADRTTAEFLAAAELERCVTGDRAGQRWQQLLSTVVGTERFVPPELRGVAAWASELDPTAFDIVFAIDPTVLVEQPGARYTHAGHARLFDALLSDDVLLRQVSHQPHLIAACIDAVDGTDHELGRLLTSPDEPQESRRRALELISSSGLRSFDSVAASLVCDSDTPTLLRYWAMLIVANTDDVGLLRDVYDTVTGDDAPVAEVVDDTVVVHEWLKRALLLYMSSAPMNRSEIGPFEIVDRVPLKRGLADAGVRIVPGAVVRWGAFVERGVVLMPSFVNIGARVGAGSMIDTWATVGSCAQVGRNVHISGGVGLGGVLDGAVDCDGCDGRADA